MYKCEVQDIRYLFNIKETSVRFKQSDIKGKTYRLTRIHPLTATYLNRSFTLSEIDKSIEKGDLLRCDGLPFSSKPSMTGYISKRVGSERIREKVLKYPAGYRPVKLDSGYWVIRKVKWYLLFSLIYLSLVYKEKILKSIRTHQKN